MKIVADGSMAEALCARSGGEPLSEGSLYEGGPVVVFAHARCDEGHTSSSHGGLQLLEQLLTTPVGSHAPVFVVGFLPRGAYGEFNYLLTRKSYGQLPCDFPVSFAQLPQAVGQEAIKRQVELVCARIRHAFEERARPAVRIALGAFACGDIPFEALKELLVGLRARLAASYAALEAHLDELRRLQPLFGQPFQGVGKMPDMQGRVLMIEDDPVIAESWSRVLNVVFDGWAHRYKNQRHLRVEVCGRPFASDGSFAYPGDLQTFELVLLDYELKDPEHEGGVRYGGSLIREIKNRAFDLPIIMFTASDEASIVKWCLPHCRRHVRMSYLCQMKMSY